MYKKLLSEDLNLLGALKWIVNYIEKARKNWNTQVMIRWNNEIHKSEMVKIERGIFQCDSLSLLLLCVGIIPVSIVLRK